MPITIAPTQTQSCVAPPRARRACRGRRIDWRSLLAALVLVAASAPAAAIEPFTVDYQASFMGISADGQMQLTPLGNHRWRYTLDISNALASLSQSTVFEVQDGHWRPISGTDATQLLVKTEKKTADYDWTSGVARWSGDVDDDESGPVPLQRGDMDALMINLALVRDLRAGNPLAYRLVDDGRAKQLNYIVAGTDTIQIGGRARQATKVVNTDGDKQTIVWIVEGMPVPARILRREDGNDELQLTVQAVH